MTNLERLVGGLIVAGGTFWGSIDLANAQITVDYGSDLPGYAPAGQQTIQLSSLTLGGITVTGSGTLNFLEFSGIGVVGGLADTSIDGVESVLFNFDAGSVTDVSIFDPIFSPSPNTVEVFGLGGVSLGLFDADSGNTDISALVGNVPITSFQFNGNNGVGQVNFVSFVPIKDDFPNGPGTDVQLEVGTPISGFNETAFEEDWFSVSLEASVHYKITANIIRTFGYDPLLRLFADDGSTMLGEDFSMGVSDTTLEIDFTPATDFNGFVVIKSAEFNGLYTLSISASISARADDDMLLFLVPILAAQHKSKQQKPVVVPNVVGLVQASAEAALRDAGLTTGTVSQASSATVPAGNVISQNPVAGASVPVDSAVNLVVSSGSEGGGSEGGGR